MPLKEKKQARAEMLNCCIATGCSNVEGISH